MHEREAVIVLLRQCMHAHTAFCAAARAECHHVSEAVRVRRALPFHAGAKRSVERHTLVRKALHVCTLHGSHNKKTRHAFFER